jgi:transcriptional regulator with XRE-family HTH domain
MNLPNPPKPDVPAEIRAEMARRGWSASQLATRAGITADTLRRRLSGDDNLTVPELSRIASAFGLSLSTLVSRAEDVAA